MMAPMRSSDRIEVARSQDVVLVRVHGLARLANAMLFEEFCADMIERKFKYFIIDLAQCRGMDSTFMGILVGLAQTTHENRVTHVCLINTSAYCVTLLKTLGLERIVQMVDVPIRLPQAAAFTLEDVPCSDEERLQIVQKAHENLVKLDERNALELGSFLAVLKSEVAAQRGKNESSKA